jgi:hypothetical protein
MGVDKIETVWFPLPFTLLNKGTYKEVCLMRFLSENIVGPFKWIIFNRVNPLPPGEGISLALLKT